MDGVASYDSARAVWRPGGRHSGRPRLGTLRDLEWLIEQGQDTMWIDQILRTCIAERGALVCKRGLVEIMVALGLVLAVTSVILFLWFVVGT
jgi:hypothetical protein